MAKNRQNPSCDREMPKWPPKSVNMPKQVGSVQPSAWHSAHTCWQQPQACVCQLRPLGANTKGQTCLKPMGPMEPSNSEAQLSDSEAYVENYKSALGWQPAHACGCMWLWQIILGAFIGRLDFFCTFLINLINLSSAAMATEFAISRPMAQRPELAFGCCFGVGSPAQAAHFRAHPTLGASTLARWHAGRPKKEISVKCRPAQKNA